MTGPKAIGFYINADKIHLFLAVADELKRRYDTKSYFYVQNAESKTKVLEADTQKAIHEVVICRSLYDDSLSSGLIESEVLSEARLLEAKYNYLTQHLVMTHRDFGHGFALGGFYHPRNRFARLDHTQIVHGFNSCVKFWAEQVRSKSLDAIVEAPKVAAVVCRAMGIQYLLPMQSRHKGYWFWAPNEYGFNPEVEKKFRELRGKLVVEDKVDTSGYKSDVDHRHIYFSYMTFWGFLRNSTRFLYNSALKHILRYESRITSYDIGETVRVYWRLWREGSRLMNRRFVKPLSFLEGKKFIYFPLQTEPESTLQVMSPETLGQLSIIASIARDLPADTYLAVKETPYGVGRRPKEFFDQIRDIKNVVLLDLGVPGVEVVRKATAIANINGTGGFEAVILGKPVVLFGRHVEYKILDHVYCAYREEDLAGALAKALSEKHDSAKAIVDGKHFLEAVRQCSFNLGDFSAAHPKKFTPQAISDAADAIVRSVKRPSADEGRAFAGPDLAV